MPNRQLCIIRPGSFHCFQIMKQPTTCLPCRNEYKIKVYGLQHEGLTSYLCFHEVTGLIEKCEMEKVDIFMTTLVLK